jgi:hypothetical protein
MALVSTRNLQRHLASGVTTIRDNGCRNRATFAVREALRSGRFRGIAHDTLDHARNMRYARLRVGT